MSRLSGAARAIISGRHPDPFHYLGPHTDGGKTVVRVFLPDANEVIALGESREERLERLDPAGLFRADRIVCIVSGGNIDAERLATILRGAPPA